MQSRQLLGVMLAMGAHLSAGFAAPLSRAQAVEAIGQPSAEARIAGIKRLADVGRMSDTDRLVGRLADQDMRARELASQALWRIWDRSGDPAIDKLFAHGVEQMRESALDDALSTFSEIIRRKPGFAEAWNKRATVYFLLGRNSESLKDCHEVLRRNPNHFGALAGAGQIYMQMGEPASALKFFQRALSVNPNLSGLEQAIPVLNEMISEKRRNTT